MGRRTTEFLVALALGGVAKPALAHPHVWVDTVVTAIFEDGKIAALREDWSFDEDFSVAALSEVRKTKGVAAATPKPLSPAEVEGLKTNAFSNLANYGYFTHVWQAGQAVGVTKEVRSFAARIDGPKLAYSFVVSLAKPLDPKAGQVRIGVWDDTYYVDVGPVKGKGAAVEGSGSESCHARIVADKEHMLYYGSVTPKVAEIDC